MQANRRTNTATRDNNGNITKQGHGFNRSQTISSTSEQDAAFSKAAYDYGKENYNLTKHNCYQQGIAGVDAANKANSANKINIDNTVIPNDGFKNNESKGWKKYSIEN